MTTHVLIMNDQPNRLLRTAIERIRDAHPERVGRGASRLVTALVARVAIKADQGVLNREAEHFMRHAPLSEINALMVDADTNREVMGEQILNVALALDRMDVVARMIRRLGRSYCWHLARDAQVVGDDDCLAALLSVHDEESLNGLNGDRHTWMHFMGAELPEERFLTVVYPKLHAAGADLMEGDVMAFGGNAGLGFGANAVGWSCKVERVTEAAALALILYRNQVVAAELNAIAGEAAPAPAPSRARARL